MSGEFSNREEEEEEEESLKGERTKITSFRSIPFLKTLSILSQACMCVRIMCVVRVGGGLLDSTPL